MPNESPRNERPKTLFRFFDHHGLDLLTHGTLKVTPPNQFNDPFEFWPALRRRDYSEGEIREYLLKSQIRHGAFQTRRPNSTEDDYVRWAEGCLKGYLKAPCSFIDHLIYERDVIRDNISRTFGVVCFSAFDDDHLSSPSGVKHWASYAANHTGMAIQFDIEHRSFQSLFDAGPPAFGRVSYENERRDCDLDDLKGSGDDWLKRVLRKWSSVKSRQWESEHEWRWILPLRNPILNMSTTVQSDRVLFLAQLIGDTSKRPGAFADYSIIRRVILGCRASRDLVESVRTICDPMGIKVWKMREHDSEFRLEPTRP